MSSPSEIPSILLMNESASRQETDPAVVLTNLRNLFYQWNHGPGHMHHDGTVWRSIEELRKAMQWDVSQAEMLWNHLGEIEPRWCCSRCPVRGSCEPDHYVTREGAVRMMMEHPQECEAFWTELLPCLFEDDDVKEPDRRLQVYGVVVATVNKGRLCPDQLFEFKEECAQKGWVRHVVGPYKESDYFKTPEMADLARMLISSRKWISLGS